MYLIILTSKVAHRIIYKATALIPQIFTYQHYDMPSFISAVP